MATDLMLNYVPPISPYLHILSIRVTNKVIGQLSPELCPVCTELGDGLAVVGISTETIRKPPTEDMWETRSGLISTPETRVRVWR